MTAEPQPTTTSAFPLVAYIATRPPAVFIVVPDPATVDAVWVGMSAAARCSRRAGSSGVDSGVPRGPGGVRPPPGSASDVARPSNESGELCCGAAFSPVPPATWMDRPDQPAPAAVRGRPADPDLARPRGRTAPGPGRVRCRSPRRCPVRTVRPTSSGPGRTWTTTGDWDPPSTPAARPGHPRRRRNGLPRWWRQRDWGRLNGRLGSAKAEGR